MNVGEYQLWDDTVVPHTVKRFSDDQLGEFLITMQESATPSTDRRSFSRPGGDETLQRRRSVRLRDMRRVLSMVAAVVLFPGILAGATACSSPASFTASQGLREPVARDEGYEVTVPALWADDKAGTSGTEPARIWATKNGSALFTIDLADIKAQGAGAQWTAASAAAAAVGSMISGVNPGRVDVDFGVSGPIDGPSAGGILTVGVVAALLDAPIRGDMTMTGTISPDGSIGPVGGITLKLQAAAEQGYRTVLLPMANMSLRNPDTNEVESADVVGKRMGLEVRSVGNVQEAFALFTDDRFAYPSTSPFVLPPAVQELSARQVKQLLTLLDDEAAALPANQATEAVNSLLNQAASAAESGEVATAYGIGMQGMNIAVRERASANAQAQFAASGLTGATTWLTDWLARSTASNSAALAEGIQLGDAMGYEQQLTLPNALSWLTYNDAILRSVQQQLDGAVLDAARIDRYARILADVDTAINVYYPNQLAIVQAAPAQPSAGAGPVAAYLSDYTTFLVTAGRAQQEYVQQVVMRGQDPAELARENDLGLLLPVVLNLSVAAAAIPSSKDALSDELLQATVAVTYYIATTSLIAAVQNFGVDQFGIGADPSAVQQPEVLVASMSTAKQAVDQVAALLGQRGLDASLPVWAAAYGTGAAEALAGSPEATAAQVLALNELYFDAITVFMLQSGPVK